MFGFNERVSGEFCPEWEIASPNYIDSVYCSVPGLILVKSDLIMPAMVTPRNRVVHET